MARFIPLALLAMPFVEIAGFIWIGGQIGIFATLAAIILTAIVGIMILRWQGLGLLVDSQTLLARGEVPARQFAEAMMLALAGLLLIIPGFFTDAIGFILLIPPLRGWLYMLMSRNMVVVSSYRPARPGPATKAIDLDSDEYR